MTALSDMIGPHTTPRAIRRGVVAVLQEWLPQYLRGQVDADPELAAILAADRATALPMPRSWRPAPRVTKWPEDQLPAVIVETPGMGEASLQRRGDGRHDGTQIVTITPVVGAPDYEVSDVLASAYFAACLLAFAQKGHLMPGVEATDVRLIDWNYDVLDFQRSRTLRAGSAGFEVDLRGLFNDAGGPFDSDPEVPGPPPIEVTSTTLTADKEPLNA